MSFLDLDGMDNVIEPTTVPDGTEAEVRIESAEVKTSKAGNPYLSIRLSVPADLACADFNHMVMLPTSEDTPKEKNNKLYRIKQFAEAFGLPLSGGIDLEMAKGATAWAILGETDDPTYGKQNRIKSFTSKR